jgi:hypothetical protein
MRTAGLETASSSLKGFVGFFCYSTVRSLISLPQWSTPFVLRTSGSKGWLLQYLFALDDDGAPAFGSCDRVIEQSALLLGAPSYSIRPENDHALKFAIFSLVDGHCLDANRVAACKSPVLAEARD